MIVSVVTIPAAVMLARYQARRTVWEQEIREAERAAESRDAAWWRSSATTCAHRWPGSARSRRPSPTAWSPMTRCVHAKTIEQESIRLSEMVDDLFEMSKINAGAVQPAYDKVALDEVVDDVLAAHRIAAERAGVLLEADAASEAGAGARQRPCAGSGAVEPRCQRDRAHPRGRHRRACAGADQNGAWARVDDTGVGIDEADLPRVFDVAYRGSHGRVPRPDSSLPSGSGLGLAIAAGLVQAHRGTLSAHNLATGARFEVRLPLAD